MMVLVILAGYYELQWVYYLTKPVLLLMIYMFFRIRSSHYGQTAFRNIMLTAFLFCALGDTLLMFTDQNHNYFLAGLAAFLIAHLLYTSAFTFEILKSRPWNHHWGQLAFAALVLVYGVEFFILNRLSFDSLWVPVLLYCIAITTMGIAATMRTIGSPGGGYYKVVGGAVLFIVSDSLLATNKFIAEFDFAGPLVLVTYFAAQYLIATGTLDSMDAIKPEVQL
jgi:uncharacterized membrane protein YhhN